MASRTGARLGRVTRITGAGAVYVELADVAPGFEFGPCLDTVGGLVVGDRIVAQALARDEDELVITGLIGGPPAGGGGVTPAELEDALEPYVLDTDTRLADARTPTAHVHHADDVNDGVLALARLPAHDHDDRYYTEAEVDALLATTDLKRATVCNNANSTLTGTPTVDGYQTVAGDRVLCVGQTNTQNNGLWLIPADGGAWVRPSDYDSAADALAAHVVVQRGTIRGGRIWRNSVLTAIWPVAHTWTDTADAAAILSGTFPMARLPAAAAALAAYPVGAIFISAVSTSPATLFGGTWTQISDRMLIAVGSNARWDTTLETGGSETVTLTTAQIPAHGHDIPGGYVSPTAQAGFTASTVAGGSTYGFTYSTTQDAADSGGGGAHDNMPPFIAVYMWRRTA